jgi:hypothetical protein
MNTTHPDENEENNAPEQHSNIEDTAPEAPTVDKDSVIIIPADAAAHGEQSVLEKKLVLIFETQRNQRQAQDWITVSIIILSLY